MEDMPCGVGVCVKFGGGEGGGGEEGGGMALG